MNVMKHDLKLKNSILFCKLPVTFNSLDMVRQMILDAYANTFSGLCTNLTSLTKTPVPLNVLYSRIGLLFFAIFLRYFLTNLALFKMYNKSKQAKFYVQEFVVCKSLSNNRLHTTFAACGGELPHVIIVYKIWL